MVYRARSRLVRPRLTTPWTICPSALAAGSHVCADLRWDGQLTRPPPRPTLLFTRLTAPAIGLPVRAGLQCRGRLTRGQLFTTSTYGRLTCPRRFTTPWPALSTAPVYSATVDSPVINFMADYFRPRHIRCYFSYACS